MTYRLINHEQKNSAHSRYEGLDWLRIWASFGVVFLHVFVATGYPNALWLLLKFRDFALPVMVMSSFFLLTISLTRQPSTNFRKFFNCRIQRLWLPFFVWTIVYSLSEAMLFPFILGSEFFGALPAPIVFLTGYRHLWFLQFVFLVSFLIYWLFKRFIAAQTARQIRYSVFCFLIAVIYAFLFWGYLKDSIESYGFDPEIDANLQIFILQTSSYALYIPFAVGIGLISGKIRNLFERKAFRRVSFAAVLISLVVHLGSDNIFGTREIYGIAVFLAALQPWKPISSNFWRTLAAYSYGIYILHFLFVQLLWMFIANNNLEPNGAATFGLIVVVYLTSLAAAVLLRKLFPADWFLPLVSLGSAREQEPINDNFIFAAAPQTADSIIQIRDIR